MTRGIECGERGYGVKVDIVELVENEMVELNVPQIGSNWGWIEVEGEDEGDYGSDYNSNSHPKDTNLTPLPPPNQSKPIVPAPSYSLS